MHNNFLNTADYTRTDLEELIDLALVFKREREIGSAKFLAGRSIALVFFNPSLRTRASMQIAIHELGGNAIVVEPGSTSWALEHREGICMDGDSAEHIAEFVHVLERYCVGIGVRTFAALGNWNEERTDPILHAFAQYCAVPIINLESAMQHPCQAMADMMTIREQKGMGRQRVVLNWAWHPKPLPMAVPNSFALACAQMGHELVIAHPRGYELDAELMGEMQKFAAQSGGSISLSPDIDDAFNGVDVVYTKSWGSSH
ncbi:MAG: N-acetylornithine carbamoyltransferase, partial [Pyrinomonadaceae bacterium]